MIMKVRFNIHAPSARSHRRLQLHMDYLSAHSTLLRGLFSGKPPVDLTPSSPESTPLDAFFNLPARPPPFPVPSNPSTSRGLPIAPLLPRVLPSLPAHPTIYLPVPDPSSLRLLIHYMYFGATSYIEQALDDGTVSWDGLARNVEFLGMGMDIKLCLGRWYGRWRRGRGADADAGAPCAYDSEEYSDSSSEGDDDDDDDDSSCCSDDSDSAFDAAQFSSATSPSMDERMEIEDCLPETKPQYARGRQRTTRRLGHSVSDPGPIRDRGFYDAPSAPPHPSAP
jgi:hypothetical protein